MSRTALAGTSVTCLLAFGLLALAVSHGHGPYGFEDPVFAWLGAPSAAATWAEIAKLLPLPVMGCLVAVSLAVGVARHAFLRVLVYLAFAAAALVLGETVFKPMVQRYYYGELTFPSGSLTGVTATTLAMLLALLPFLGSRTRIFAIVIGSVWTLFIALAVVGALWHTPIDDLGSMLLSVGIVTGGAALLEGTKSGLRQARPDAPTVAGGH